MTLADVYRFPVRHSAHHRAQLTLAAVTGDDAAAAVSQARDDR